MGRNQPKIPATLARIIWWLGYVPFDSPKTLGEELWQIRMIRGITAAQASEEIGVDQSTYGRWEADKRIPNGAHVLLLDDWIGNAR